MFNRNYIFNWCIFHCHVSFRGGDCLVARDSQSIRLLLTSSQHFIVSQRNEYAIYIICFWKRSYSYFYSQTMSNVWREPCNLIYGKYTPFTPTCATKKTRESVTRSRLWCSVIVVVDSNSFVEMHPLQFGVQVLSQPGPKTARSEWWVSNHVVVLFLCLIALKLGFHLCFLFVKCFVPFWNHVKMWWMCSEFGEYEFLNRGLSWTHQQFSRYISITYHDIW